MNKMHQNDFFKLDCAESEPHFSAAVIKKILHLWEPLFFSGRSLCVWVSLRWQTVSRTVWALSAFVCMCTLYIFLHVYFVCEIERRLVVSCRRRSRLMVYRQVIYDLLVAGSKEGDVRLSQQINKLCSGGHIASTLHVCDRAGWGPALLVFTKSPPSCVDPPIFLSSFGSCTFQHAFFFFFKSQPYPVTPPPDPPCNNATPPPPLFRPLWLSLFRPPSLQGVQAFDMVAIIYRNMVWNWSHTERCCNCSFGREGGLQINFKVFLGVTLACLKQGGHIKLWYHFVIHHLAVIRCSHFCARGLLMA